MWQKAGEKRLKIVQFANIVMRILILTKRQGKEYPIYNCQKRNDTSLDFECKDFERFMKNDC